MRTRIAYIAIFIGIFEVFSCFGANLHWKNSGTDMLKAASYRENQVPTANDTIYFDEPMVTQPYLSADLTVKAIIFGLDNGSRTTTDTDPDGYIFTGAEGKKLTLTLSGKDQYCINALTTGGTAVFRIPIVFSAGTATQGVGANGITLVFESPIATANSNYQQDIVTVCNGADASHNGKIVLSAANPDFKPLRIHVAGFTYLELRHSDALINVPEFMTGHWAREDVLPHLINRTGKPFVWDALTKVTRESYGLNNFFFEGDPFVLTNCTFAGSIRNKKSKTFNAEVTLKRFASEEKGSDWQIFVKSGTNVLHLLEAPYEGVGCTGHVQVVQGMIHVKQLDGIAYRPYRSFQLACRDATMPATLAVDGDTNIRISDNNGISFYKLNNDKNMCGFSALSGTAHVRLCGPDGQYLPTVTSKTSCDGQTYWMMPEYPSFGHPKANGTVVFMNDYVGESGNNNSLFAMRGGAKVAVRFNGSYTIATDREFYKRHNGVAAFDGSFNISNKKPARVYNGGGILMNCDDHNGDWYLEKDGSWIGGKGGINAVEVKANSFIRPGEDGIGEFTLFGVNKDTRLLTTGGIFAEIGYNGGSGCVVCKGGSSSIGFIAESGCKVLVDGEVNKFAPGKKRVKIIDWSQISDQVPSSKMSMFNIDNYTVEIVDSHKFKKAWLEKDEDEKAIYLVYIRPSDGFSMVFRP